MLCQVEGGGVWFHALDIFVKVGGLEYLFENRQLNTTNFLSWGSFKSCTSSLRQAHMICEPVVSNVLNVVHSSPEIRSFHKHGLLAGRRLRPCLICGFIVIHAGRGQQRVPKPEQHHHSTDGRINCTKNGILIRICFGLTRRQCECLRDPSRDVALISRS